MGADPVDRLVEEWGLLESDQQLADSYRRWRAADPAFAELGSPARAIEALGVGGDPARKDVLLCALLRRARSEPLAGRVVLQTLLPGLKRLARRMLVDARDRDELWSSLLTAAWERICTYPVERRPRLVAANLLLDTLHIALRQVRRDGGGIPTLPIGDELNTVAAEEVDSDVDALIDRAVAAGAISPDEGELILATRFDGVSLAEIAAAQGAAYNTLAVRRLRAERRLSLHLGYRPVKSDPRNRLVCRARVAGRSAGRAGGHDQSTPEGR